MNRSNFVHGLVTVFTLALLVGAVSRAESASVPTGFTDAVIASGITWPTTIAVADDGRVFVAEQGGALRVARTAPSSRSRSSRSWSWGKGARATRRGWWA